MGAPETPGPLIGGPNPRVHLSTRRLSAGRRFVYAITAPITVAILRLLWFTYRFDVVGDESARATIGAGRPLILTTWHHNVFVCSWYFRQLGALGANVTYLVSPSMDGEFAVRVLSRIRCQVVRGSATRSGVKALRDMFRAIQRRNASPVILPDGPQGPPRQCRPGSLLLSQMAKAPVLPLAAAVQAALRLPTWDRLVLPYPFSRVAIAVGEPFEVAPGLDEEALEDQRQQLAATLDRLDEQAQARLGRRPGSA
jgi:lysophospholipid acyltransferase (LPLAT)-like uncharacterized protein